MANASSSDGSTREGGVYATLVGDVAASRSFPDQKRLFAELRHHFQWVNERVHAVQPLRFSVGDEFQAAYETLARALRATILLRLRFKEAPLEGLEEKRDVRIGLAFGEISVFEPAEAPFAQSGPGWWLARSAIEEAESRKKGPGLPRATKTIFAAEDGSFTTMTNAFLVALDQVIYNMDRKDVSIALGTLLERTQQEIGEELGIGQSTVSKRSKNNGPATILMILETLEHLPR